MNTHSYGIVLILTCLLFSGCGGPSTQEVSSASDSSATHKPAAEFDGVILHTFPDGKTAGIDSPPASAGVLQGFNAENTITRKRSETERIELNFKFELLDHRAGKDIYRIEREVTEYTQTEENAESGSGRFATFEIEYDGSPTTIANDQFGVTKLMSRELGIQDGKFVDGSKQSGVAD